MLLLLNFFIILCVNEGLQATESKCESSFYGELCNYQLCPKDIPQYHQCHRGDCLKNKDSTNDFKCLCQPGYTGALCEKQVCDKFCYNNGNCVSSADAESTHCQCVSARFSGNRCEFDKCHKDQEENKCGRINNMEQFNASCTLDAECDCLCGQKCGDFLCHNQGDCVKNEHGLETCKCKEGFTGPTCEQNRCVDHCLNGGACSLTNTSISCECPHGFSGIKCELIDTLPLAVEKSRLRTVIYGFAIALWVCLLSIGVYYIVQNDYLTRFFASHSRENNSILDRSREYLKSNFSFTKLNGEEDQGLTEPEMIYL